MRKIYFLPNLNKPFLVVEFRQTVCSIVQIVVLLWNISTAPVCEEVSTVLQWRLGVSIFFQASLKEKLSFESLYGKIAGFFFVICRPERFERKTQGRWTKLKPVQLIGMINWFVVFKPVKYDIMCADYVSSSLRCFIFPQNFIMDIKRIFTGGARKEKDKDNSSEKKRLAEEGASARPPLPKRKFQQSWKSDSLWAYRPVRFQLNQPLTDVAETTRTYEAEVKGHNRNNPWMHCTWTIRWATFSDQTSYNYRTKSWKHGYGDTYFIVRRSHIMVFEENHLVHFRESWKTGH